jgi:replicative DNA helicase
MADLEQFERGLPANLDAERAILGGVLLENDLWRDVIAKLRSSDFALDSHLRIAKAIKRLMDAGNAVDLVTLVEELERRHELQAIGGVSYLVGLTEGLPRRINLDDYIRIVKDKSVLRQVIGVCSDAITRAADQSDEAMDVAGTVVKAISQICDDNAPQERGADIADSILESMDQFNRQRSQKASPGLSFGIGKLDELTGGMMPGFQTAAGAVSGAGKTTFLAQAALATLQAGHAVELFLFEPTKQQITFRLLSLMVGCRYSYVVKPWTCPVDVAESLANAAGEMAEWGSRLRMHDRASMTLDDVLVIGRRGIEKNNCRLIGTDYVQRMKIRQAEKDEPVRLRVGRASTAMADLVKGTQCHSLLLSQINTGRRSGTQATPTMFDFRESSQIENDACTIVLLHRDYDEKEGHFGNTGAIFVPKQRFGSPCNIKAWFDPYTASWLDHDPAEPHKSFYEGRE